VSHKRKKKQKRQSWQRKARRLVGKGKDKVSKGTDYLRAMVRKALLKKKAKAMRTRAIARKYPNITGPLGKQAFVRGTILAAEENVGVGRVGAGRSLARVGLKGVAAIKAAGGGTPTIKGKYFGSRLTSTPGKMLLRAVGAVSASVAGGSIVDTIRGAPDIEIPGLGRRTTGGEDVGRLIDRFKPTAVATGRPAVRTVGGQVVPRVSGQQVLLDYGRRLSNDEFFQAYGYHPSTGRRRRSYTRHSYRRRRR